MTDDKKEALAALQQLLKLSEREAEDLLYKLEMYFASQFVHQNYD